MKNNSTEGILYPKSVEISSANKETTLPALFIVPRKSWNYVESQLTSIFSIIGKCRPTNIFVLSHLRNGKISFDDEFTIYTDSDCPVENSVLTKDDDICSEEFGAEILRPLCDKLFPNVRINQFLTPEANGKNAEFFEYLLKNYKNSLFFISRNESEDPLWPESLQD